MLNRTVCDVLEEMRTCLKVLNFSMFPSLIEEVQIMAQRMEGSLWDQKEITRLREEEKALKKKIKALKKKCPEEENSNDTRIRSF